LPDRLKPVAAHMAASAATSAGRALSLAGILGTPIRLLMQAIDVPMRWVQRRAGTIGVVVVLLAPNMLVFGVFVLIPLAINIVYSFTGGPAIFLENRSFVGLDQYRTLFDCENYLQPLSCRQDSFWRAVHNTGFFVVAQVTALVIVSLITALVLNREMRARGFWRAVFFFPVLLSPVVVALIWKWVLLREGLLNAVLVQMGLSPTLWLAEPWWATFWAIFVSIWAHLGFYTLILLAGLQAIPRDVQVFDEVYVLTGGGPGSSTLFLTQYIYQTGFADRIRNLGLAASASIAMGIVLVVLTSVQLAVSGCRERRERA
jgi:alpha-1,4-digalacturonate transport system permease protein